MAMFSMQFGGLRNGAEGFTVYIGINGKRYELECSADGTILLREEIEIQVLSDVGISWVETRVTQEEMLSLLPADEGWTWEKLMLAKEWWLKGYGVLEDAWRVERLRDLQTIEQAGGRKSLSFGNSQWSALIRRLYRRLQQATSK